MRVQNKSIIDGCQSLFRLTTCFSPGILWHFAATDGHDGRNCRPTFTSYSQNRLRTS
jgi:hypothetical protein